jgi:hypothetical protein
VEQAQAAVGHRGHSAYFQESNGCQSYIRGIYVIFTQYKLSDSIVNHPGYRNLSIQMSPNAPVPVIKSSYGISEGFFGQFAANAVQGVARITMFPFASRV